MGAAESRVGAQVLEHVMQGGDYQQAVGQRPHAVLIVEGLEHDQGLSVVGYKPDVEDVLPVWRQYAPRSLAHLSANGSCVNQHHNVKKKLGYSALPMSFINI